MNLFGRNTAARETEQVETIIGPSANLRGTLQSDGGVRIEGVFEGIIETAGNVIIGEGAKVVADITARNVTVGGAIKGNVEASGRLEILSTGIVYGDMSVQAVMIDEGGQFHGASRMRGLDHPALAPPEDHRPQDKHENGAVDIRLDDEAFDVKARHRDGAPASKPTAASQVVIDDNSRDKTRDSSQSNSRDKTRDSSQANSRAKTRDGTRDDTYDNAADAARDNAASHVSDNLDDEFELHLDDLDLDFDVDIDPIIPESQPQSRKATRRR